MKPEEFCCECPKCGCKDKKVSRIRTKTDPSDVLYIPNVPDGDVGVIRCSECGHIFEYCKSIKPPLEVKKIQLP